MTRKKTSDRARPNAGRGLATLATYGLATIPALPALAFNVTAASGKGADWVLLAVVCIVLAAVFADLAAKAETWTGSIGCFVAALLFVAFNIINAASNATSKSDQNSDHRRAMVAASKTHENQVARQSQRREALARISGEVPSATVLAEIGALTAANAQRWQSTEQCTNITAGPSRQFCAERSTLAAKMTAAREREAIDADLAKLARRGEDIAPAPVSINPFVDSLAAFMAAAGATVTEDTKRTISAARDWFVALMVEVAAAFGPSALMTRMTREAPPGRRVTQAQEVSEPERRERPVPNPTDDPVYAFIATEFIRAKGRHMPANEPWQMWLAHCAELGIQAGSQRAFGMAMKACHSWERNHNRPRYVNVAPRNLAPSLRLAVSNG